MESININRAPFLTLWATVVAQRAGYAEDEALTLGRAISGLTAQSKGRRLGLYEPSSDAQRAAVQADRAELGGESVPFMGRSVPCVRTSEGLRALARATPVDPGSVRKYLLGKFGDHLSTVEAKLRQLAATFDPQEIEEQAMDVYMRLRPQVPPGTAGWGKAGALDLTEIDRLTASREEHPQHKD